jgi:hypothetical protein
VKGSSPGQHRDRVRPAVVAKVGAASGLALMAAAVFMLLIGGIQCSFLNEHCGAGVPLLGVGAAAFLVSGLALAVGRHPGAGAVVAGCGVVSAILMRVFWTVGGPWMAASSLPAIAATIWLFQRERATRDLRPSGKVPPAPGKPDRVQPRPDIPT